MYLAYLSAASCRAVAVPEVGAAVAVPVPGAAVVVPVLGAAVAVPVPGAAAAGIAVNSVPVSADTVAA